MAKNRNVLRFTHFTVWILLYVAICGAEDYSGDFMARSMMDLPGELVNITNNSSTVTENDSNTTMTANETTKEMTTLVTKLTTTTPETVPETVPETASTDQPSSTRGPDTTTHRDTLGSTTTSLAETTSETVTVKKDKVVVTDDKEKTELMTTINGYKIATICLAAILGIVLFIILIYFSAKSKSGHADITNIPGTPPQDEENVSQDEEFKPVRLSSYFPHADNGTLKVDHNDNGDVDMDERKVTSFLTKKKPSLEEATGSRDKILHTSEL